MSDSLEEIFAEEHETGPAPFRGTRADIKKDWFGRTSDNSYTYYDERKRLFNWDSGQKSYSNYLMGNSTDLRDTAKLLGSMFRVAGVPKDIKFTPNKNTSVKKVQIPLQMLKNESGEFVTEGSKIDAFFGAALQNAAQVSMQTESEYSKTLQNRNTSSGKFTVKGFMSALLNSERIDKKFGDRFPGYTKFIQKFKEDQYDQNYTQMDPGESKSKRLLDLVTRMIRFPKNVTEEELEEFKEPLERIRKMFERHGGIPDTYEDCDNLARGLSKLVLMEEENPEESSDEKDENGDGPPDGKSDGKSPSGSKKSLEEAAKNLADKLLNQDDKDSDDPEDNEGEDEKSEFNSVFDEFSEDMTEEGSPRKLHYDDDGNASDGNIKFIPAPDDKKQYQDIQKLTDMAKASALRNLFKRKSKDYSFSMKSMRSGRLDTNKIAEAVQRVPTIYERYGSIKTDKICVGVLIDESGSMGGSKIHKAQQAAIFINEVFGKQRDIDLFVYGHTADQEGPNTVQIRIYKEPGKNMSRYALGTVQARSNNRDGDAIYACAKRMRGFTANMGILLVISDGQPAASGYGGMRGITDTREKVTKSEKLGFQVVQIAIETSVPSEQMFTNFVKMTDIKTLPAELTKYMSRKVDKLIREVVSL